MKQIARSKFNSSEDDSIIFCAIEELPKLPRIRRSRDIIGTIYMRNIKQMKHEGQFRDENLNGFLGILNYKYKDNMDYANTFFLPTVQEKNFEPDYIKLVMRSRLRDKTIFDLDNYFVLNHIGDFHWGIIHISP